MEPKLRTADKIKSPYPLGQFPRDTVIRIAGSIVYLLYTRSDASLEGRDWEEIFARAINAEWKPSNIGLDDIQLGNCCWSAKTVKQAHPAAARRIRLISGRNSLDFSYNESDARKLPPAEVGQHILGIWNTRVSSLRQRFAHCRTVVLIKGDNLSECALFEFETLRFEPELYKWEWNKRGNLEDKDAIGQHKFTWQPHGAQFTIIEEVPPNRIAFQLRLPEKQPMDVTLGTIGFDATWVTIL